MWIVKLTNWLFGWQWVATDFMSDTKYRKVRRYPNGKLYFRHYWCDYYLDGTPVTKGYKQDSVQPLTWQENTHA